LLASKICPNVINVIATIPLNTPNRARANPQQATSNILNILNILNVVNAPENRHCLMRRN